ncbi:MAG: ABC transporter permease [bacterium]|nr:ABC transporter permease [bacterium]
MRSQTAVTGSSGPTNTATPFAVVEPGSDWRLIDFAELRRFRQLLWILAQRDIKIRYKQTVLGAAWAVLQPLLMMLVFTIFFGNLAGVSGRIEGGIPYPLYTFCALLPWQLFANSLNNAGHSLVNNQNLVTKVYFPRLILPLSAVIAGVVDFAIAFGVLLVIMLFYGVVPGVAILTLPLFVAIAFVTAFAAGLWLSALNVQYRDVRYVIPFLTQFWMFASPIAYPSSLVREKSELLHTLYGLNPMAGVVDGFRWALLDGAEPPGPMLWVSLAVVALMLIGGLAYFRRMESEFADVV